MSPSSDTRRVNWSTSTEKWNGTLAAAALDLRVPKLWLSGRDSAVVFGVSTCKPNGIAHRMAK